MCVNIRVRVDDDYKSDCRQNYAKEDKARAKQSHTNTAIKVISQHATYITYI